MLPLDLPCKWHKKAKKPLHQVKIMVIIDINLSKYHCFLSMRCAYEVAILEGSKTKGQLSKRKWTSNILSNFWHFCLFYHNTSLESKLLNKLVKPFQIFTLNVIVWQESENTMKIHNLSNSTVLILKDEKFSK